MTTVKVKFRPSSVEGRPGRIVYHITLNQMTRQITSEHTLNRREWEALRTQTRVRIDPTESNRTEQLAQQIRKDLDRINRVIENLKQSGLKYTTEDIIKRYQESRSGELYLEFMSRVIERLRELGREGTSENYSTAKKSFLTFLKGKDIRLSDIDSDIMMDYEVYLKSRGVTKNTISFYNRIHRAVYNRAVEMGFITQHYPFKHVYTGIDKTIKRALPENVISRLKRLDLSHNSTLDYARDMFMFSFYTRGMAFVDMAYLRRQDLRNGVLTYRRRKTGQQMYIRWEETMQEIIDKYPANPTGYLLPIIKTAGRERLQYKNALRLINHRFEELSALLGLDIKLTMYVSRHSWASIARNQNIPLSIISAGMGHNSENTTRIYLASIDNSTIDDANKIIMGLL